MFPPMTSTLSLDAYLHRNRPQSLQIFNKRPSTPAAKENRRYRRLIRTFLTTLCAEALRERLRYAAEIAGKSIQAYLEQNQWNILKAIGDNQVIIDLVFPRVSEYLGLSSWGPLLTCLVLKAAKCLSEDEIIDVTVIDKLCRKYITRYKCKRRKGLKRVKKDWSTICSCTTKLADSAKNAKLIKSVRNFIDEVALGPYPRLKRPRSAPARMSKNKDLSELSLPTKNTRSSNLSCDKMPPIRSCTTEERRWLHHIDYRPPKQIILSDMFKPDKDTHKKYVVPTRNVKKLEEALRQKKIDREHRLREACGRILSPIPIPRTFADIAPVKRHVRLAPLKLTSACPQVTEDELQEVSRNIVETCNDKNRIESEIPSSHKEKIRPILESGHNKCEAIKTGESYKGNPPCVKPPTQAKGGYMKRQIKHLAKNAITLKCIQDVADNPLFSDSNFIDGFFIHLETSNQTEMFLRTLNAVEHEHFRNVDGSIVHFSFFHYCLYKFIVNQHSNRDVQEYLLKQILKAITCYHDLDGELVQCCWKCTQKSFAMEMAIRSKSSITCKFLLQEDVPYREEHLLVAVQVEDIDIFRKIILQLKEKNAWHPKGHCVRNTFFLAQKRGLKQFVKILRSEGVVDAIRCLTCFKYS